MIEIVVSILGSLDTIMSPFSGVTTAVWEAALGVFAKAIGGVITAVAPQVLQAISERMGSSPPGL